MSGYFVGPVLVIMGILKIKNGMKNTEEPGAKATIVFGVIMLLLGSFDFLSTLMSDS